MYSMFRLGFCLIKKIGELFVKKAYHIDLLIQQGLVFKETFTKCYFKGRNFRVFLRFWLRFVKIYSTKSLKMSNS